MPTTKSVAVSIPTKQIEKRYVTKNIEDIQVGDEVYAYDIETGKTTTKCVTSTFKRTSDHLRYLTVRDSNGTQTFETTDSHPFWVVTNTPDLSRAARENVEDNGVLLHHENLGVTEDGYYVEAGDLRAGDVFVSPSDELSTLEKTERTDYPTGITVYNFEVEDNHNYFVIANIGAFQNGAEPILVHNSDCNSRTLAKNIVKTTGKVRPVSTAAHHIVAGNDPKAKQVRKILEKHKIDINDADNGVFLKKTLWLKEMVRHTVHCIRRIL
jgi:hypothetical protein